MIQARKKLGFGALTVRQAALGMAAEKFDGDLAVKEQIVAAAYFGHPAGTEEVAHLVSAVAEDLSASVSG
ncbi:hypothetical protein GCM10027403_34870 [Arthrobacter tecti]